MTNKIIMTTIAIFAIVTAVSATGAVALLGTIQIAHAAAPEHTEPHGTCLGSVCTHPVPGNGASGEAGNFGGFIVTPNGRCHTTGGPNNEQGFQDSC
jgi:hypothetical protein